MVFVISSGIISAAYNTSISGISSVAGLNIRSITSVSGVYLGINSNGYVGTVSGPAFVSTSVTGAGVSLITSTGLNTYSISGMSQWISTGSGILYSGGNVGINNFPTSNALEVTQFGTASGIVSVLQNGSSQQTALAGIVNAGSSSTTAIYGQSSIPGANILMANSNPSTTLFKVTTGGVVQIASLSGVGTRFVFADPSGNLSANSITGFVQGTNTSTATSLAIFTGQNSSITGTNNLTWNNSTSTLGINGNVQLSSPNVGGSGGAVIVQMFSSAAIPSGSIVIVDPTLDNQIVVTNQQGSTSAIGVIVGNCSAASFCNVAISGIVPVRTNLAIRGQHCITSTSSGQADSIPSPDPGSSIGVYISNASGGFANVLLK